MSLAFPTYYHQLTGKHMLFVEVIGTYLGASAFVDQRLRYINGALRPILYPPILGMPNRHVCLRPSIVCFLPSE